MIFRRSNAAISNPIVPAAPNALPTVTLLGPPSPVNRMRVLTVPMTTSELAQRLHLTPAAVSQQLGVLRRSGVVDARRQGREVYSELTASGRRLLDLLG